MVASPEEEGLGDKGEQLGGIASDTNFPQVGGDKMSIITIMY